MATKSLGTLTVDLLAKTGGFERGMTAAERQSAKTAKAIKRRQKQLAADLDKIYKSIGIGLAAAFAGAVGLGKKLIDTNDQLYKMARRAEGLNVSVKFLSGMSEQADDLGVNLQQVAVVLGTLNRQIATAQRGSATAKGMFAEFGIDPAKAKSTEAVFLAIADSVRKYGLNAKRAGILTQIFGASGKDIVPILQQGADAIRANNDAMAKTGQIITDKSVPQITALYNATDAIGDSFTALRNNLVVQLAPALVGLANHVNNALGSMDADKVSGFTSVINTLARSALVLGGAFVTAGHAIGATLAAAGRAGHALFFETDIRHPIDSFKALGAAFTDTTNIFKEFGEDTAKQWKKLAQEITDFGNKAAAATAKVGKGVPPSITPPGSATPLAKDTSTADHKKIMDQLQREAHALDGIYKSNIASINGVTAAEQAFNERMAGANALLQEGRINWQQYDNIAQDALQNLNSTGSETFDKLKSTGVDFAQSMQYAFGSLVDSFASGIANMLEGGKLGFKAILKEFLKMVEKMIIEWLILKAIMGIGGAMGGTANGTDFASFLYRGGQMAPGRAIGGPVSAGTTYLVGEKGPELFTPSSSGTITPNSQLRTSSSAGGITYNMALTVNNNGGKDDSNNASAARQLGEMIKAQTKATIVRALQPGGILWKAQHGVTA